MADFTKVLMHIYVKRGAVSSETIVEVVGRSFVVVFGKNMMVGFSPVYGASKKTTKGYFLKEENKKSLKCSIPFF
jgi:hypothetical protein